MDKHAFSREIKSQIKPLYRLNNYRGVMAVLLDFSIIFFAIVISSYNLVFLPLTLLLIGSRQRALATVLHEAAHGTFAKNRKFNKFLGTYLSGYLVFQSWESYKKSHTLEHHHKLGDPEKDPDYIYYINSGVYEEKTRAGFLVKHVLSPMLFLSSPKSLIYLIKNRLLRSNNNTEVKRILASQAALALIGSILFGIEFYLLYWLLPYLTVFQALTWFIELSEHYPMISSARKDINATRNRFSHPIEHFFTGMHGENFHLIHHLFLGIPFWNLKKAHNILLQDKEYAAVNSQFGGIFFSSNYANSVFGGILLNFESNKGVLSESH